MSKTTKLIKTELKPSEVSDLLSTMITNNVELSKQGIMPIAFNIEGSPGISKTSVVKQVVESLSTHYYIRLNVAEIEVGDLIGFPITQYQVESNNSLIWINENILNDYISNGYKYNGISRMSYALPDWLVGKQDKPVVLVLDDYNRGLPIMMNACMRLTDEQETSSWKLPLGSTVILTCNPDDGDDLFNVSSLDTAQKSRFITIKMKASVTDWADNYAEKANIPSAYINFLLKHPEIIEGTDTNAPKGNLRLWTKFFHAASPYGKDLSNNWHNIFLLGQNSLHIEHLILMQGFIEDKFDKLPEPEALIKGDIKESIKILKSNSKRVDVVSILSRRITNYTLVNYKKFTAEHINNYFELLGSGLLSTDLVLLAASKTRTIFNKPEHLLKFQNIIMNVKSGKPEPVI
jgi:hypothetical protein